MSRVLAVVIMVALGVLVGLSLGYVVDQLENYAQCVEVCAPLEARDFSNNSCLCGDALETRQK